MTHNESRAEHSTAILMLLLANFFWGLSFPLIKALGLLHQHLDAGATGWFLTAYSVAPRFLVALLVMAVWKRGALLRLTRKEVEQGLVLGLFAAAGMLLQSDGLQYTEASTSAFLTQLYAISIPLWLAIRGRRNPGAKIWVCSLMVLAGVAILGRFDWQSLRLGRGEWETLLCSFFFMGQILTLERPAYAGNRAFEVTWMMCLVEAVIFWGMAGWQAPSAQALLEPWQSAWWVGLTVVLGVFCTVWAFVLMNRWQPKITATEAGLIYCVEPVFGSLMALVLPGLFSAGSGISYANEHTSWTLLVGGGLITAANVLLQKWPQAKT